MKPKCSVPGCRRRATLRGFCRLHYRRDRCGMPLRAPVQKRIHGTIEKRLRAYLKVDAETGCHLWTGARDPFGYGCIVVRRGRHRPAHRVAWEAAHAPIPDGMVVMHICDNPPCCNPEHLALGTRADNARDRAAKRRGPGARARDLERYPQWR